MSLNNEWSNSQLQVVKEHENGRMKARAELNWLAATGKEIM